MGYRSGNKLCCIAELGGQLTIIPNEINHSGYGQKDA